MERDPENNGVLATCEELGIGFVPWGPVGMGYLTGKVDARTKLDTKTDLRSGFDRFAPHNLAANRPILEFLERFAEKKNATPAQIALSWVLAHPQITSVLVSVSSVNQLRELFAATRLKLDGDDVARLGITPVRRARTALAS